MTDDTHDQATNFLPAQLHCDDCGKKRSRWCNGPGLDNGHSRERCNCNCGGTWVSHWAHTSDPAAVSLGRKGGKAGTGDAKRREFRHLSKGGRKGGKAKAARMTRQQRIEWSRKANAARSAKRQANTSSPG